MSIHSGPPVLTSADVADHFVALPLWLKSDYVMVGALTLLALFLGCVGAGVAQIIRTRF